jgi:HEXXH motif-containing protein
VFINRRRLTDGEGMPGRIRYAEHLAHESTHVRLHAAAGANPFLVAPGDRSVLVKTPLRDDPRPLNGLFQQFVVLSRCRALFDRMLACAALRAEEREPAAARRELLAGQAVRTAALLSQHRRALTDRGLDVLHEAGAAAR